MDIKLRTKKGSKVVSLQEIPGVLYGKGIDSKSVKAQRSEFIHCYLENGKSKTFEIKLEGKKHLVYIKDIHTSHLNYNQVTHFDLLKVSLDDTLVSNINLELLNADAVKKKGLDINIILNTLDIEYAVGKGISHLELDVSSLEENDSLLVKDIVLPEGIKVLQDPEDVVVSASMHREIIEEEETEEQDEVTEVEVIKQQDE
ncbi:MAG: 50S ribosomal protein L25 [Candidatus Izimaplasma bacterium HR2]|nr:MAG: 50S ribosomal protein L25 [Candidatus Izimaplasma bacterium HR2]